jgi:hypothetical protein
MGMGRITTVHQQLLRLGREEDISLSYNGTKKPVLERLDKESDKEVTPAPTQC